MIYTEFRDKYNGKFVERGGSSNALNQCVDLVNAYMDEVLNQPFILGTNAQDFPSKMPNYERINNSPTGFPKQGDIIVWSSPDKIGHIGICDSATVENFVSFDQNWPLKSPCKLVNHTYTGPTYNVLCWMRLKTVVELNMTDEQKNILAFIGNRTEGEVRQAFGALQDLPNLTKQIDSLKDSHDSMEERLVQLEADAKANNELILGWQSEVSGAKSMISKLQADVKAQADEKNVWKNRYENALNQFPSKYGWKDIINLIINKLKK